MRALSPAEQELLPAPLCPRCQEVVSLCCCVPPQKVTLPYPISANRYWISFYAAKLKRVIVAPTKDAKAHKEACAWQAKAAGITEIAEGPVLLRLALYPKGGVCMDLDNALKVTIDSLRGIAYADDAQLWRIEAERRLPDGRGARVELEIEPMRAEGTLL